MAETTVAEWLQRAERLAAANRRVHETFRHRAESDEAWQRWIDAADVFRAAVRSMYPNEFLERIRRIEGDGDRLREAITFLEADPWCFRSGYIKADLLRRLAHLALAEDQQDRLREVLLHAVDVGDRREFKWSCRLARALLNARFERLLREKLTFNDKGIRRRAFWMIDGLSIQLSAEERRLVHHVIMDACFDREWWRTEDWVRRAVRKYEDKELHRAALAAFRDPNGDVSPAVLRVLSLFQAIVLEPHELAILRQRVVVGLESGDFYELETVAQIPGIYTADLAMEVSGRLGSPDQETARRSSWVLRWLKRP